MRTVQLPDSLLVQAIRLVTSDLENLERSAGISLEAQVRVYDLYQELLRWQEEGYDLRAFDGFDQAAAAYGVVFKRCESRVVASFDAQHLKTELDRQRISEQEAMQHLSALAEEAVALHELAKETFSIWQSAGFLKRHQALNRLRKRAGFPLEKKRIGNYVAKTYDLMNEARQRFAQQQQACLQADVFYKIQPDLYGKVAGLFISLLGLNRE